MKSESELLMRIEELSTSINAQKQILQDLKSKRIQVQCELNAVRDPMAKLPVEISAEIFLHCLPSDSPDPEPDLGPGPMLLQFLDVCHAWRSVALSTPALWTRVCMSSLATSGLGEIWIGRARSLSLRIERLVEQYGQRLWNLELFVRGEQSLTTMEDQSLPVVVEYLRLLPTLTDLEVERTNRYEDDSDGAMAPFRAFVAALGTEYFLPNLRTLTMRVYFPYAADYQSHPCTQEPPWATPSRLSG
ncbi:hypothetical protein C8R47DRAFT_1245524 [Mycena vitilis]|nr:hypothetical protein C8R47DRAFT_1245524 [Mycena vitilis]